jgi:hypothetical protein
MKVNLIPFQSTTRHKFWCSDCDNYVVDSNDSNTGNFFKVDGHEFSRISNRHEGKYTVVMFAVCRNCLDDAAAPL